MDLLLSQNAPFPKTETGHDFCYFAPRRAYMRCLKSAVSTAVQSTALCSASGAAVSKWKYPRFSASCSSMRHLAATSFVMISGYSAEVHYLDEDADEVLVGEQLQRERKPLGFIFLGGNTCSFEARFSAIAVPSVLATTLADHLNFGNLSSVGIDDTAAGRRAARFLLSRGHRRIAVIGGNRAVSSISDQRYQGFLQGFADEGLSHDEALYQKANYNLGSGYRAMNKLLARDAGFTAVFCMSDIMAVGAMRALTDAGLRVPQDISVLGFDGIELGQYAVPRLATVSQPQQEIADQSVALLLGQIEKAAPPQTRVVSTGLLEGESVASVTSDI